MPPPPWLWHPEQFIWLKSCCPCEMAGALLSKSAARASSGGGVVPPGQMVSGLCPAGTVSPIGLERLCRSSRSHAFRASAAMTSRPTLARQGEDIEHASRRGFHRKILDGIGKAEGTGRIARVHLCG